MTNCNEILRGGRKRLKKSGVGTDRNNKEKQERDKVMGMAASQARFLGLTARKTNTEYEGQQVNQQRTTLANKSANYYNDLLGMTVPTPPSVEDYTKTTYTFNDGALENSINSLIAQANGTYLVSYTRTWQDDNAVVSASSSIVTRSGEDGNYIYSVGSKTMRELGSAISFSDESGATLYYTKQSDGSYKWVDSDGQDATPTGNVQVNSDDEYLKSLTAKQIADLTIEEQQYVSMLSEKYGESAEGWQVIYRQNTSDSTWVPTFYKKEDLTKDTTIYSDTGSSQSFIPAYTIGSEKRSEEVKGATAQLEQDASGRYINITIYDGNGVGTTYALTTNTVTDQDAYDDAMNQYEYNKSQYDKSVQDINSKIEIIQAQDRTLELRLKQLDTEQEAIQTEMEAVQKVIEKNTGDTFKTFG